MNYYYLKIQVDLKSPRAMPPSSGSKKAWNSVGYFQQFYCTAQSETEAQKFVHQFFLEHEENPSTCQFNFDLVKWMSDLTDIKDIKYGFVQDLTEEMFARRDKIGIWYFEEKKYYMSEKDSILALIANRFEESDELDDDSWGGYEGQCQACDEYGPVDDMSLCPSCSGKLERDIIRLRDWNYSALAFGLPDTSRERLRNEVIKQYGKKLEMIAPEKENKKRRNR